MKKKILALTAGLLTALTLTACGKDPALTQFKEEIDSFCTEISDIDTEINNVDATSENATDELIWISWTALFRILQRWIFLLNLIIWNLLPMKQANI